MFDVECQDLLPIQFIEIQSVSVRGDLGRITVYTCDHTETRSQKLHAIRPSQWVSRYGPEDNDPSSEDYVELKFNIPLRLAPGQMAGIYVHSELPGDTALVYDDYRGQGATYENEFVAIHPGFAHTSNVP